MMRRNQQDQKATIEKAMDVEYTDFEKYVKAQAMEHTVANLGQDLGAAFHSYSACRPDQVVEFAYSYTYQIHGEEMGDEGIRCVEDELKDWMKEARKNCGLVKKAGLPFTLRNSRDAFEQRGYFAKQKK